MRGNKIPIENLHELLGNIALENPCTVCKNTLKDLQTWTTKEMKREGWS